MRLSNATRVSVPAPYLELLLLHPRTNTGRAIEYFHIEPALQFRVVATKVSAAKIKETAQ